MINVAQGSEKITSKGGNILIGTQLPSIGLEKMNHLTTSKTKYGKFSHSDIAKMAVTLLANGKSDFADIDLYRNDTLFKIRPQFEKVLRSREYFKLKSSRI